MKKLFFILLIIFTSTAFTQSNEQKFNQKAQELSDMLNNYSVKYDFSYNKQLESLNWRSGKISGYVSFYDIADVKIIRSEMFNTISLHLHSKKESIMETKGMVTPQEILNLKNATSFELLPEIMKNEKIEVLKKLFKETISLSNEKRELNRMFREL